MRFRHYIRKFDDEITETFFQRPISTLVEDDYDDYEDEDWYDDEDDEEPEMTRDRAIQERDFAFDHWFPKGDRIYLNFETSGEGGEIDGSDEDVIQAVEDFKGGSGLPKSEEGYKVINYPKGLASPNSNLKIQIKIGKILRAIDKQDQGELSRKLENDEISQRNYERQLKQHQDYMKDIIQWFEMSPTRSGKGAKKSYMVVISKDPQDIELMSTGRDWTSCMNLEKGERQGDVYCEIQGGGFIAYLTTPDDTEIKKPKARVLIRRFDPKDGNGQPVAMVEDSVYGWDAVGFLDFVKKWVESKQGKVQPGFYSQKGSSYSDTFGDSELITPESMEDLWKWVNDWAQGGSEAHGKAAVSKLLQIDNENPLTDKEAERLLPFARQIPQYGSSSDGNLKTLLKNHPKIASEKDLNKMSNYDLQQVFPGLPEYQQTIIKKQVYDHLMKNLIYPSPLMKPDPKGESPHSGSDYDILNLYNNMLEQAQIFRPIPDPIVKKMTDLATTLHDLPLTRRMQVKYAGVGPTGKTWQDGELEERIMNQIAHTLSMTHTDSPSALQFFRQHLSKRGEPGFDFSNQTGYNSWFGAVGGLGAQGQEFVGQLQYELARDKAQLTQAEQELAQIETQIKSTDDRSLYSKKYNLERRIYQLKASEEQYNWAIDSILSGKGRSEKYNPF